MLEYAACDVYFLREMKAYLIRLFLRAEDHDVSLEECVKRRTAYRIGRTVTSKLFSAHNGQHVLGMIDGP